MPCVPDAQHPRLPGFPVIAESRDRVECRPQLRAQLRLLSAAGPWPIYLTSACLSFLACKLGQRYLLHVL